MFFRPVYLQPTVLLIVSALLLAGCANRTREPLTSTAYRVETLVGGGPLHGANGITFGPDGWLYVGSVSSQTVYRVNVDDGSTQVVVPAPDGEADDVAFSPDGTLVWTALLGGELRALDKDGDVIVMASKLPLINPVDFTRDGRLFVAQIGLDRLHEIDPTGNAEPRLVASKMGNLNSFEITDDDKLYGPLVNRGSVATIDIDSGDVAELATGLGTPVAVNLNSKGLLYAVDWPSGKLWRVNVASGEKAVVTTLEPPLDNLAIGTDDAIFISRPAASAIDRGRPRQRHDNSHHKRSVCARGWPGIDRRRAATRGCRQLRFSDCRPGDEHRFHSLRSDRIWFSRSRQRRRCPGESRRRRRCQSAHASRWSTWKRASSN